MQVATVGKISVFSRFCPSRSAVGAIHHARHRELERPIRDIVAELRGQRSACRIGTLYK